MSEFMNTEFQLKTAAKKSGPLTKIERRAQHVKDFWFRESCHNQLVDFTRNQAKDSVRTEWENSADRKALHGRVQWEMGKVQEQMDEDLQRRRKCLGELLQSEQASLLQEAQEDPEDEEAKMQRMLARYQELRAQKEEERLRVVQEKREQQFKGNCEELRSLMSRKLERETVAESRRLQAERQAAAETEGMDEILLQRLWAEDAEAKRRREEAEAAERRRRDLECARDLAGQAALNKVRRIRAMKDKCHDAEIMAEKKRLDDLEEEWSRQQKKQKQKSFKSDLDKCLRAKLKRKAQEVQDELTQDLYFLKQIMEKEDKVKEDEKKRDLMREQQLYRQYLREQLARESEFEKELDRMYQEELERTWEKRQQEWEREKSRRREMERDVIRAVKEQLAANIQKSRVAHAMNREFAEKVRREDEEDRKADLEKLRLIRERNAQHQKEILDQIKEKQEKLEDEQRVREEELESVREARELEEAKIQKMLSEMQIDKEHPYRLIRRELFNECDDTR